MRKLCSWDAFRVLFFLFTKWLYDRFLTSGKIIVLHIPWIVIKLSYILMKHAAYCPKDILKVMNVPRG